MIRVRSFKSFYSIILASFTELSKKKTSFNTFQIDYYHAINNIAINALFYCHFQLLYCQVQANINSDTLLYLPLKKIFMYSYFQALLLCFFQPYFHIFQPYSFKPYLIDFTYFFDSYYAPSNFYFQNNCLILVILI